MAFWALSAAASPAQTDQRCDDAGASMVELKDCLFGLQQDVEREMALAWSDATRAISARDFLDPAILARYAAAADRAQATWRAYREADCVEVTGFDWWGGSGAGVAIRSCMIETAAARVRDLVMRYDLDASDYPLSHAAPR